MRISDWSSDVCSSDLGVVVGTAVEIVIAAKAVDNIIARKAFQDIAPDKAAARLLAVERFPCRSRFAIIIDTGDRKSTEETRVGREGVSTCRSRRSMEQ